VELLWHKKQLNKLLHWTSSSVLANSYARAIASPAQIRMSTSGFCSRSDSLFSCLHTTPHHTTSVDCSSLQMADLLCLTAVHCTGHITPIKRRIIALQLYSAKQCSYIKVQQEAQLMLTTGSTRLAVSQGQQTWYHSTCYI